MRPIFFAMLILVACSYQKSALQNQKPKGHQELYSEPETPALEKLDDDERRIVIAGTNDLHGHLDGEEVEIRGKEKDQKMRIGGAALMADYFRILRDHYRNVVLVDSGDLLSDASDLAAVKEFYEKNRYDALTVGLRDFNLKVPEAVGSNTALFRRFAQESTAPLLLSNLYDLKTARVVEWAGTKPYLVKEIDGVKVGIIGLIPDDIVAQTPVNNRIGLFVENMLQSTLRHARLMRSLGAEVIVVLTHQGIDCASELAEEANLPKTKVNFEPEKDQVCDLQSPLGEYLQRLPHGLVDVVVAGRNHLKMANVVNGTVVIGSFPDARSFSYTELVVNVRSHRINHKKTKVHQPVYFCQEFFKESNDCYFEDQSVDHRLRIPAKFLGKALTVDKTSATPSKQKRLNIDVNRGLEEFGADLSYVPPTFGETQLMVVSLQGRELLRILEEDYNQGLENFWKPSPFLFKDQVLSVSINGLEVESERSYRILADLEALQRNRVLKNKIRDMDSKVFMTASWNLSSEDQVSLRTSAPIRISDSKPAALRRQH